MKSSALEWKGFLDRGKKMSQLTLNYLEDGTMTNMSVAGETHSNN